MKSFASSQVTGDSLLHSALFTPWVDPKSGVTSYLLSRCAAPLKQSFYFVNPSISENGRYCWFYCAFPPGGSANQGRSLAVADLVKGKIHHYPETAFTDASPMVDERTGEVYWCSGLEIWKRRPEPDAAPIFVNRFPGELALGRRPWRLATHLTFSSDRRAINLDVEIGNEWFIGHAPIDGGDFVLWQKFDRCYNHAQFSPVDPDLQLLAQDHSVDPSSGEKHAYENRLWLIRRGEDASPIFPHAVLLPSQIRSGVAAHTENIAQMPKDERRRHGHEWWGRDGRHIWYVHYGTGIERIRLGESVATLVWPHSAPSHAHANAKGNWLVADSLPSKDPSNHKVLFRSLESGNQIDIVSHLPETPAPLTRYHIHPHPQFCLNDELICYTTTVRGACDVAFVSVADLVSRTS